MKIKISFCQSPVGIWPHLSNSGFFLPSQELIGIGNIEEEILHVNRRWWIYPSIQYSAVLSQCDLLLTKTQTEFKKKHQKPF